MIDDATYASPSPAAMPCAIASWACAARAGVGSISHACTRAIARAPRIADDDGAYATACSSSSTALIA